MEFLHFKNAVAAQFEQMKSHNLYRTGTDKDAIWDMYLNSYPEGTNNMFRQRREHDCNTCKQFIRNVGNVVAVVNGKLVSIWDCVIADVAFQTVANALSQYMIVFTVKFDQLRFKIKANTLKDNFHIA